MKRLLLLVLTLTSCVIEDPNCHCAKTVTSERVIPAHEDLLPIWVNGQIIFIPEHVPERRVVDHICVLTVCEDKKK